MDYLHQHLIHSFKELVLLQIDSTVCLDLFLNLVNLPLRVQLTFII